MPTTRSTAEETVVFLHAHPDDEAIFTGGTMRLLADAGARVVLVVATRGEAASGLPAELARTREAETRTAAGLLGVDAVHFLGYTDSGLGPDVAPGTFAAAPVEEAATRLATILRTERATAVVAYDPDGIYGHPDHVQVERVGARAAADAGVDATYQATVDREYLHFVETHLVEEARRAIPVPPAATGGQGALLGLAASSVGLPSVLVDLTVDVRRVLDVKRKAMLAHESQITGESSAVRLGAVAFAEVYGFEWYARTGRRGPLDELSPI